MRGDFSLSVSGVGSSYNVGEWAKQLTVAAATLILSVTMVTIYLVEGFVVDVTVLRFLFETARHLCGIFKTLGKSTR